MLIDAHQHYWSIGRHGHEWPTPDLGPIYRDFGPAEWERLAVPLGFGGSVLVQSQPSDLDTDFLAGLAERTESVLAVVGWADLAAPDAPRRIASLAARPKLRGLRPMLQNLPDDAWIAGRTLDPAIRAMIANGLSLDALVFTRHLPHLRAFAERWTELPIVIDHAAKPPIAARQMDPWREEIAACARLPNIMCKLSGLMTEARSGDGAPELAPYLDHILRSFGPERLMWGSDWPVLELAGGFADWLGLARQLSGLEGEALGQLLGGTAARFYRIAL